MSPELRDYYKYEIWTYSDGSFTLHLNTDVGKVDLSTAEALCGMTSRTLREMVREDEERFSLHIFESGGTSTSWSSDDYRIDTFERYLWLKRTLHYATYECLIPRKRMPRWAINVCSIFEFLLFSVVSLFQRDNPSDVIVTRSSYGPPPPPDSSSELPAASEDAPASQPGAVVVPFKRPG